MLAAAAFTVSAAGYSLQESIRALWITDGTNVVEVVKFSGEALLSLQ